MFSGVSCQHAALDSLTEHHQLLFKLGTRELLPSRTDHAFGKKNVHLTLTVDQHSLEGLHLLKTTAGAECNTGQRIVGD